MTGLAAQQTWTAKGYEKNARFVSDLGAEILSWLAPAPGMRPALGDTMGNWTADYVRLRLQAVAV